MNNGISQALAMSLMKKLLNGESATVIAKELDKSNVQVTNAANRYATNILAIHGVNQCIKSTTELKSHRDFLLNHQNSLDEIPKYLSLDSVTILVREFGPDYKEKVELIRQVDEREWRQIIRGVGDKRLVEISEWLNSC